ncbi:MAG: hypothetical protein WBD40_25825 [Tepidisphaeraceae bacterium]
MIARAAITDGKGNYSIDDFQVGDPGSGEVLVQIKASGVCHTGPHRGSGDDRRD